MCWVITDVFVHVHVDQGVTREAASEIGALDTVTNVAFNP
jgi:hypothetical protein